jgi:DNA modification methylase
LSHFKQLSFLNEIGADENDNNKELEEYPLSDLGTFKDNLRAPIHSWFQYPAGYSYKFVDITLNRFDVKSGDWVYDPFSGTGTTLICAQRRGINGYGVEAHSFVHWVADVKLYWDYDFERLFQKLEKLLNQSSLFVSQNIEKANIESVFPELIYKCYHPDDLKMLYLLREFILNEIIEYDIQNLLKLALTDTLRSAAAAGTGWPYISPRKNTGDKPAKGALAIFQKTVRKMYIDLRTFVLDGFQASKIYNVLGDSREKQNLPDESVKISITSPPYLNNFDYADRTRLETYFWGITKSWKEITEAYRDKLIVSATTQITRRRYSVDTVLSLDIKDLNPDVYQTIQESVLSLAELRTQKGGKKDYDLMTALYFNDILQVIKETYRLLQKGGHFCLVLGDSAPYGIHVRTEQLIGELGVSLGFRKFDYIEFRKRGNKWKENPQRHKVKLHEGIIVLTK